MTNGNKLTLCHSPNTRSSATLTLLEELGVDYDLRALNFKLGEQKSPEYLAINPLGKVPAVVHGEAVITEQCACFIYLADAFPAAGLAPAIGDPLRGPYLRWIVFYGTAFEPAIMDRHMKREPAAPQMSAYGAYDSVMDVLRAQLARGPYLLGDRFTAADVLWATALRWTTGWGLAPALPEFSAYIERVCARPAFLRVAETDAQLQKIHEAAAQTATP